MDKLGLIAGGGSLPDQLANHCRRAGRDYFIIRLKGFADPALASHPSAEAGMAQLGKCFKLLRKEGCKAVCFAGNVERPDFSKLMPDMRGLAALPAVISAARKGDDALLRAVVGEFEKEGFIVEGAHEVEGGLTLSAGPLGRHTPAPEHQSDIERALQIAREIGRMDVGQGAVVCDGLVLAVEAQEGTDAMLRRVAELPEAIRGTPEAPCGVLAKAAKPIQETRIDLPTIGVATVQRAARAGLAGIVGAAGQVLVVNRAEVVRLADEMGLFVLGVEP